ncbi:MAG: hypothetical protein EXS63_07095 [Candidatus Omnitrophica bacterium]|nr:hypothetical protein [Candidatus Omnitrophota bacterium]
MSKLKLSSREIGSVRVFDLEGDATQEDLQAVAWKIQKNIRRHRLQRIILNIQKMPCLDLLGVRKLLAACLRPQRSVIYGASSSIKLLFENTYMPRNVHICDSEVQVAEDLGPFLLEKEKTKEFPRVQVNGEDLPPGIQMERRRSKRMHVALPLHLKISLKNGDIVESRAIATNISEGGLFAKYLDLDASRRMEELEGITGLEAEVLIHPSGNFQEEYRLKGFVRRKELDKKQLGIAIEFIS